ncbi:unnamed protein product [Psylliodes chrysocephalus]|uniref:DUF1758 domain-containing protein n=1 Tax=Psylliodes chrysocephalus TaxID=3402493 RepID=A0A9P0CY24_9CUCU|nr:unnamed protein product [Psylliodes chrysocephala]
MSDNEENGSKSTIIQGTSSKTVVQLESSDDKLKRVLSEREILVSKLTRFINFTKSAVEENLVELETRLDHVQNILFQFDNVQNQIESLDKNEMLLNNRESFENSYYKSVATARNVIIQMHANINQKGRLQGEAAAIIQDIELTDENYSVALQLLIDRYENKRVIVDKHVDDLFNIPDVVNESAVQLRRLIDSFKQHLRSLKALGEPTDSWDRLLIQLIKNKLDKTTRDRWQEVSHSQPQRAPPKLSELMEFLVCRCEFLESIEKTKNHSHKLISNSQTPTKNSHFKNHSQANRINHTFSAIQNTPETKSTVTCFYCNQSHAYSCTTFLKLALKDKYKEIMRLGLCINCLRKGHSKVQCSSGGCKTCHARHNTILHGTNTVETKTLLSSSATESNNECNSSPGTVDQDEPHQHSPCNNSTLTSSSAHSIKNDNLVLLSTAIIYIKDHVGNLHTARALLDVGSQSNYITTSLAKRLQLREQNVNISIFGVGQNSIGVFKQSFATIKSMQSTFEIKLPFLILPQITDQIPNVHFNLNHINIPSNISLADPTLNKPGKIDILLGAALFYDLLNHETISLGHGNPTLQSTQLGWILAGSINFPSDSKTQKTFCALTLNQQLVKFWELEETPTKKHLPLEENFCETFFKETTIRDSYGRFVVKLPFNESLDQLGDSKPAALKRLGSIEKRFERDTQYKRLYVDFINEYKTLNHMSLVGSNIDDNSFAFYLPHHGVKKESSSTTKLRVVYDGSATTDSGISLNQCLGIKPTINNHPSIIYNYRSNQVAIIRQSTTSIDPINCQSSVNQLQMNLSELNKCSLIGEKANKPVVKLSTLPLDIPHTILAAKITKGKFGESVLVELDHAVTFLPNRVTELYRPSIKHFTASRYAIVYRGAVDTGKPQPAASFEIIEN